MTRYMCRCLVYVFNVQALLYFFSHHLFFFLGIVKGKTIYMGGREGESKRETQGIERRKLWGKEKRRKLRGERRD